MVSDNAGHTEIRHCLPSFKLEKLTTKILQQNSNRHKGVELWAKRIKDFGNFGRHFSCASSTKLLAVRYARVSKVMTQFVLKIEKLSHIMGPTPILEMARAYGLRPRLWLLVVNKIILITKIFCFSNLSHHSDFRDHFSDIKEKKKKHFKFFFINIAFSVR